MRQGMKVITTSMVMLVSFMIFSVTVLATSFDFDSLFEEHERVEEGGYAFDMHVESGRIMDDAESVSLQMHILTVITEHGNEPVTMEIFADADMVVHCFDSGDIDLRMDMLSDDIEMTVYYRDGMMYLVTGFINIRTPASFYDAMASMESIPEFPRESVIAERIVLLDEGTEVTLLIDINYTELVDDMRETVGEDYQLQFSNVLVTALIGEAGFSRLTTMSYSVSLINEYGEIDTIEFFIEIEVTQFGDVEIYFPAYIDDFWFFPNLGW